LGAEARTISTRVRAFDGLRGLAVAAVLLFHAQISWMRGGFLGVSAFFTLSGYLITALLLDEHARAGAVSLRTFWSRRARRLLPAAYLAIAGVLLYGATVATADQLRSLRGDVVSALAYVANWHFYFAGRSYAQLFTAPSPVLHFWSLAIEEQFYIVFPLLLIGALRLTRGRRHLLGALFAAVITASVVESILLFSASGESRVYYGTDTRSAELLIGGLLAVALHGRAFPIATRRMRVASSAIGAAALTVVVFWWATVDQTASWLYHGGFAVHAVLIAIVITAVRVDGPLARAVAARPIAWLGGISYGVYLFHWPIYLWLTPARTGLATGPLLALRLAVTLPCAIASYYILEQPILRNLRVRGRAAQAAIPITTTALIVALVGVTASAPASAIVLAPLAPSAAPQTVAAVAPPKPHGAPPLYRVPSPKRPLRILVVGDSVGLTLGRGFEQWARNTGSATVENLGHIYCPLGRDAPYVAGFVVVKSSKSCDWTATWQNAVRTFDPDVTILLFTIWEAAPREVPGTPGWSHPGQRALDQWQLGEYEAAADTLSARGGQVVWMTPPCEAGADVTKQKGMWYVDERTIPRLAAARPAVHVLDLNGKICPRGAYEPTIDGVANARPDGTHFSDPGALAIANWAMPIILGQTRAPAYPRER
jgi:peptidoglycan/LPS O-acetylase OafA/YrhL